MPTESVKPAASPPLALPLLYETDLRATLEKTDLFSEPLSPDETDALLDAAREVEQTVGDSDGQISRDEWYATGFQPAFQAALNRVVNLYRLDTDTAKRLMTRWGRNFAPNASDTQIAIRAYQHDLKLAHNEKRIDDLEALLDEHRLAFVSHNPQITENLQTARNALLRYRQSGNPHDKNAFEISLARAERDIRALIGDRSDDALALTYAGLGITGVSLPWIGLALDTALVTLAAPPLIYGLKQAVDHTPRARKTETATSDHTVPTRAELADRAAAALKQQALNPRQSQSKAFGQDLIDFLPASEARALITRLGENGFSSNDTFDYRGLLNGDGTFNQALYQKALSDRDHTLAELAKLAGENQDKPFIEQAKLISDDVWSEKLSDYAEAQPLFLDPLVYGYGNCVARALWLTTTILKTIELPPEWRVGLQVYDNHVEAVLFRGSRSDNSLELYLLSSNMTAPITTVNAPIYDPAIVYALYLGEQGLSSPTDVESLRLLDADLDADKGVLDQKPNPLDHYTPFTWPETGRYYHDPNRPTNDASADDNGTLFATAYSAIPYNERPEFYFDRLIAGDSDYLNRHGDQASQNVINLKTVTGTDTASYKAYRSRTFQHLKQLNQHFNDPKDFLRVLDTIQDVQVKKRVLRTIDLYQVVIRTSYEQPTTSELSELDEYVRIFPLASRLYKLIAELPIPTPDARKNAEPSSDDIAHRIEKALGQPTFKVSRENPLTSTQPEIKISDETAFMIASSSQYLEAVKNNTPNATFWSLERLRALDPKHTWQTLPQSNRLQIMNDILRLYTNQDYGNSLEDVDKSDGIPRIVSLYCLEKDPVRVLKKKEWFIELPPTRQTEIINKTALFQRKHPALIAELKKILALPYIPPEKP